MQNIYICITTLKCSTSYHKVSTMNEEKLNCESAGYNRSVSLMAVRRQIDVIYKLLFKSKIKYAIRNSMSLFAGIYRKYITAVGNSKMSFYASLTKDKLASSNQGGENNARHIQIETNHRVGKLLDVHITVPKTLAS